MTSIKEARRLILEKVANGEMDSEQAARLMIETEAVSQSSTAPNAEQPVANHPVVEPAETIVEDPDLEEKFRRWKAWWVLPFGICTFLTILSGLLVYNSYHSNGLGVGFWFSVLLVILGLMGITLFALSANAPWVHIRIHQKPGETPGRIFISLPFPLGLVSWFFHTFQFALNDEIQKENIGAALDAVKENINPGDPIYIHVNDTDGTKVEVFIG